MVLSMQWSPHSCICVHNVTGFLSKNRMDQNSVGIDYQLKED